MHITRDAVFDEAASWDWGEEDTQGARHHEDFAVEYIVTSTPGPARADVEPATTDTDTDTPRVSPAPASSEAPPSPQIGRAHV